MLEFGSRQNMTGMET